MGKKYDLDILSHWGAQLMDQLESFDMEKIPGTLTAFPRVIKEIRNLVVIYDEMTDKPSGHQ